MFAQWLLGRALWVVRRIRRGPPGDAVLIEGLAEHLVAQFAGETLVYHEVVSEVVHVDVHVVPPGPDREHYTLVTSGMGARPMPVPPELAGVPRHIELVMLLPADWRMQREDFKEERWYWPVQHLKMLARAPHRWGTWWRPRRRTRTCCCRRWWSAATALRSARSSSPPRE